MPSGHRLTWVQIVDVLQPAVAMCVDAVAALRLRAVYPDIAPGVLHAACAALLCGDLQPCTVCVCKARQQCGRCDVPDDGVLSQGCLQSAKKGANACGIRLSKHVDQHLLIMWAPFDNLSAAILSEHFCVT